MSRTHIAILLVAALSLLLLLTGVVSKRDESTTRELVIVSYGGSYQAAQRQAFFEPFEEEFNVTIRDEVYSGDLAQIEQMVASGDVEWDIVAIETSLLLHGARETLFEPIDYTLVDASALLPEAVQEHGVALCFWSNIMAYNTEQFSGTSAPSG